MRIATMLLLIFVGHSLIAQEINGTIKDSSVGENVYVSPKNFRKKVMQLFGQLATGQTTASVLTNYADADIANGKLGFNGTAHLDSKGYTFLSIGANGKINNSVSQVFNGYKLNTNTSVDLRLNVRFFTKFYYTPQDAQKLKEAKAAVETDRDYQDRKTGLDSLYGVALVDHQALVIKKIAEELRSTRAIVNAAVTGNEQTNANIKDLSSKFYALLMDSIEAAHKIDSVARVRRDVNYYVKQREAHSEEMNAKIDTLELTAPWSSFHLAWVGVRISPSNSKFYLYDSLKAYNHQVTDTNFTTAFYGIELNYYYWSRNRQFSVYANLGAGRMKENNLDSLDSYEITDVREEKTGVYDRKVTSKYNGYVGKYNEFKSWKLYSNVYFFTKNNESALHIFPDVRIWDNGPTIYNVGTGFVLSFKSKKDDKTIINGEPFIQFVDLSNKLHSELSAIKRNVIGLRIGLPINPYSAKKKD